MSSPSTPAKRACDSCHRRKVRCIGEGTNPCKNCISAGLTCTYNAIPQKKGPKGSRAKVLSELRETQRQSQILTGYPDELGFDGRPVSSAFIRTPGLLPPGLVESCVEFFFGNLYPSQPILHRQRIQDTIMSMEHSTEAYCMIVALCACVMTQSNMSVPPNVALHGDVGQISNVGLGAVLLEESIRVRRGHDYIENPTLLSAITSFFYFGSYFGLDKDNTAWFHLREATTLAQLMGMHDEETYKTGDAIDCSRMRRLYWLLFVTERTHALHKHRPLTLHATIHPPNIDEDISERPHMTGFLQIVNLYKPFDDTFISLWNKVRTNCSPAWLAQLQNQLSDALPTYLECTEIQAADLKTSQHWLRMMVWQLCVSQGFVSSMATDNAMTFKYPIEISRDLLAVTHQFSQQAMEVHGVGLVSLGFIFSASYQALYHASFCFLG
ncbi:hypothetical protein K432DRAFT_334978 [Lepidopterella palustris CBS 459.81]|uniref:Zn(2)-C6 fungal-type domain-containing protein n=1 Tax=Lepidopterella palustris CBS 459.81 TaxID=1314670 RepID=A0A8E2E3R2_9PEZI|nr:hypothetical protein K432DRAFT_334978 [Lepidopterella palustris CBS 459.81]